MRKSLLVLATFTMTACASLPDKRVVQIGDTHIAWTSAGHGRPTVVLQSGFGDDMSAWSAVYRGISPRLRVFAYDRPGSGASGPIPGGGRSPCKVATELREILRAAGEKPPYLLVGHSLGGQYQYAFARLFPQDVAGLILLDPTHPDHWRMMQSQAPGAARIVAGLRTLAFSQAMREEFDDQGTCLTEPKAWEAKAIPIRILVRSTFSVAEGEDFRAMVSSLQSDWIKRLPGSTLSVVTGSSHNIHKEQPMRVVTEVLEMAAVTGR